MAPQKKIIRQNFSPQFLLRLFAVKIRSELKVGRVLIVSLFGVRQTRKEEVFQNSNSKNVSKLYGSDIEMSGKKNLSRILQPIHFKQIF